MTMTTFLGQIGGILGDVALRTLAILVLVTALGFTVQGVIAAASFPRTCAHLEEQGVRVTRVDASELAKAEGALTCCSVLVS